MKVILIGHTSLDVHGLNELLDHINAPDDWTSDAQSDIEQLTEVYGRLCYKSFGTELNENITKVRTQNSDYLSNIIKKGDGSVLEHAWTNWVFCDVSRVFTHELVRHRVGTAISQESLRYVKVNYDSLFSNSYFPISITEDKDLFITFASAFGDAWVKYRELFSKIEKYKDLSFDKKKELTSAFRRILPEGVSTNIGWSANMRTLRHVIEMRTHPSSEEEIRKVFAEVGNIALEKWPNLFNDYEIERVNGTDWFRTENAKV